MLRKRTRSHQKDQHMNNLMMHDAMSESCFHSDMLTQKHKNNSFLSMPGLFVGFNPRSSESDSARSPTSPLDFRIFSSFGNPFRHQRPQNEGYQKSWGCNKVGLSIIDSLDDESYQMGNITRSSDNKSILFGRQMNIRSSNFCSSVEAPKSLPKNVAVFPFPRAKSPNRQKDNSEVVFEIGETLFEPDSRENFRACSLDSGRSSSHLTNFGNRKSRFGYGNLVPENKIKPTPFESGFLGGSYEKGNNSGAHYIGSIPASEIELSEDYTCVRTHGPNPKITHIFGDCILECHNDEVTKLLKKIDNNPIPEADGQSNILVSYPPDDFLKFCFSCQKKLDGEDIYMYRGEKAFCSYTCRSQEIEIDEEMEKPNDNASEISDKCEEISKSGLFINTT